jgi:hypothetical protein
MKCSRCDKQFEPQRCTARFCSTTCRVAAHRQRRKVETVTLNYAVKELFDPGDWVPFLLRRHYAKRRVGARRAFGLFLGTKLVGVVLFSVPAGSTLAASICGPEYADRVLELSRLSVPRRSPNAASYLIGQALRMLGDAVVVSFADAGVGHIGTVYQATNWLYTGRSAVTYHYHHPVTGRLIAKTRRHIDVKAARLGLAEGQLIKKPQPPKHRYVTVTGNRRFQRQARAALRYEVLPYPKGRSTRHRLRPMI